jgi:hypothetical protein
MIKQTFEPCQKPSQSIRLLTEAERLEIDAELHADKLVDGYGQRDFKCAMRLQIADQRPVLDSGVWA